MLVGGIRSIEVAEELVGSATADCIALSRPLIREPGLIARWQQGDRRKAECVSCNQCSGAALDAGGVRCVAKQKALLATRE